MKLYGTFLGLKSFNQPNQGWKLNISGKHFPTTIEPQKYPTLNSNVIVEFNEKNHIVSWQKAPELPEKTIGNIKAEWVNLDEGKDGDYNPEDPADENYLRFDLSIRENPDSEWEEVSDGSYCTLLALPCQMETLEQALGLILEVTKPELEKSGRAKHTCEALSWLNEAWVQDCLRTNSLTLPNDWHNLQANKLTAEPA